jgi:hypothetical protein
LIACNVELVFGRRARLHISDARERSAPESWAGKHYFASPTGADLDGTLLKTAYPEDIYRLAASVHSSATGVH